jgi:hypothetical protein
MVEVYGKSPATGSRKLSALPERAVAVRKDHQLPLPM